MPFLASISLFCPFPFYEHLSVNFSPSLSDISLISFPLFTSLLSHAHIITPIPNPKNHFIISNLSSSLSHLHHNSSVLSKQSPMEPQTQLGTEDGNKAPGSSVCRQSSTRWTPTTEQIRILKELYYNKGLRSPSAEQIQRICLQLKRFGKIEGKNVFYWFQNHKARERQKKRFTSDVHVPMQRSSGLVVGNGNGNNWKPEDQYMNMNNKYSNISQGVSSAAPASASSTGVVAFNGQMGNYGGNGSMNMEKSFRDCSISAGTGTAAVGVGGSISHNFGSWVGGGGDPYSSSSYTTCPSSTFLDMKEQAFMEQQEEEYHHQEIETLPLFPMHGEEFFGNIKTSSDGSSYGYYSGGYGYYNGGARTSLELSLNSYGYNTSNYFS